MIKTPEERFDEIKKEIIQISESYTLVKQGMKNKEHVNYEKRHFTLLHIRLIELIKELNSMTAKQEINMPIIYKTLVNALKRSLFENADNEYKKESVVHLGSYNVINKDITDYLI